MINVTIVCYNCIGTISNRYIQIIDTTSKIHSALWPSIITSRMETSLVIFLVIQNWNQFTMIRYSRIKNLLLIFHQVWAQMLLIKHQKTLLAHLLQVIRTNPKKNQSRRPLLRKSRNRNLTVMIYPSVYPILFSSQYQSYWKWLW